MCELGPRTIGDRRAGAQGEGDLERVAVPARRPPPYRLRPHRQPEGIGQVDRLLERAPPPVDGGAHVHPCGEGVDVLGMALQESPGSVDDPVGHVHVEKGDAAAVPVGIRRRGDGDHVSVRAQSPGPIHGDRGPERHGQPWGRRAVVGPARSTDLREHGWVVEDAHLIRDRRADRGGVPFHRNTEGSAPQVERQVRPIMPRKVLSVGQVAVVQGNSVFQKTGEGRQRNPQGGGHGRERGKGRLRVVGRQIRCPRSERPAVQSKDDGAGDDAGEPGQGQEPPRHIP